MKCLNIFAAFLLMSAFSFAQVLNEDPKVYSSLIRTEIHDSAKSIAVIKNSIDSTETSSSVLWPAEKLKSPDSSEKYDVYFWTEASNGERPVKIDSVFALLIVDFCSSKVEKITFDYKLKESLNVYYLEKFPIEPKSVKKDWGKFYKKYPGSGGIFSFSKIKYYGLDKNTAIFYYWRKQGGLSGHGALAVMTKSGGEWGLKYKIYLWTN